MNRLVAIKELMRQKSLKRYLEIGVFDGYIFFKVKSSFKIAVDPKFVFEKNPEKVGKYYNFPHNISNKYHEITSDDFFEKVAPVEFKDVKPNLVFVDGMHEYHYALRDIENSLKYLTDDGVIIVHDCNPRTKIAAGPIEEWHKANSVGFWNGDVWKAILHLRSLRNDINVFTLDCDHGLGIITKGKPEDMLQYTAAQIEAATYEDFDKNREKWLNLKKPEYFFQYFGIKDPRQNKLRKMARKMLVAAKVLPPARTN